MLALFCGAALAGFPVYDLLSPGVLAGLGALGGMPLITGETISVTEQLAAFDTRRKTALDKANALMQKAADEGRTLDVAEAEEYDQLQADVRSIDQHLERLKAH